MEAPRLAFCLMSLMKSEHRRIVLLQSRSHRLLLVHILTHEDRSTLYRVGLGLYDAQTNKQQIMQITVNLNMFQLLGILEELFGGIIIRTSNIDPCSWIYLEGGTILVYDDQKNERFVISVDGNHAADVGYNEDPMVLTKIITHIVGYSAILEKE